MTTRNTKTDGTRTYTVPDPHDSDCSCRWKRDEHGNLVLDSVTSILRIVNKPALPYWAANKVADYALDNISEIQKLLAKDDRDGAYRLLKGAPWSKRDKAADVGTTVHDVIEKMILDKAAVVDVPTRIAPYITAFHDFLKSYEGAFDASEMTVFNTTHGYAGTLDALWKTPEGKVGALDWKTRQGKKVAQTSAYETERLQVSAYVHAEWAEIDGEVVPMPPIAGGSIVMLCEDGYAVDKVSGTDWEGFIAAKRLFDWREGL